MRLRVNRVVEWASLLLCVWSGHQEPRARGLRVGLIDFSILVLAAVFPWSTTATSVLIVSILVMTLITHGPREMMGQLKHPACYLPIALIGLALLGTTWAYGVPWSDRLQALEKVLKILLYCISSCPPAFG